IANNAANTGSYSWQVPDLSSNDCLIRISDTSDGNPSDVSDHVFSIVSIPAATLTVNSPNGGENWQAGSTHDITWTSTGSIGAVKIEFSSNGGSSWNTIANNAANTGSYSWQVPDVSSNDCLIRISDTSDGNPSDVSDHTFSIVVAASLTLLAPNGGEQITSGTSYQIKWNSSGEIDQVKLDFSADGGTSWETIANSTPNDGDEDWQVGSLVSNACLIRIADARDGTPFDQSDSLFQIIDSTVGVQAANLNDTVREFMLLANYPNPVRWSAINQGINIMYQLPHRSHVKLTLYDQMGREMIVLTNEDREAGVHQLSWNGLDKRGELVPSGIYLYRLEAGALQRSNKIVIVR
ncbi:MAG: T9SS type A sorting domain-containing protein, partial [candidate division KSB1 bacterium]|nr:T9SS type A sorting domain-containing protein [candidate division KSB1 bacterium]